ncbi:unnamed protein product [Kluyveromyces dobzhanskii CBS 2104]|uniref:Catalase n=1 Tax=Kluyveromyces dobzhanskii CBS 2104 TaxID=1427455 RepID=A0A0A8L4D5_9SACH|nr:unnamed protein product [Kluyveromyces dobzhanskii CBS 2104]
MSEQNKAPVYTTSNGFKYSHHPYGAQYSRPDGPILLQDTHLIESLARFDRERIPERVVHAKGGGCRFEFEITDSLSDITYAAPYQTVGYKCPGIVRFSTVGGESASPDTARDPRGVSFKFYSKWGNFDWVFNNTPVFFLRDGNKFPHFIHTQKRRPDNHLGQGFDTAMFWDYLTQNVESIHQITYMFGDRGTPASWAEMHAYSGHTFKFINAEGKLTYVQFHVLAEAGFKTLTAEEAGDLAGKNPDHNNQDLYERLKNGERPKYSCYVQTMTPEQAENFRYSVNDLTKIWPHKEFPLRKFATITLTENVDNYFEEIEQVAFSPSNTCIPGVQPSNDSVLQARLFSYPDTQRHRLGANYLQLPVNRPVNMGREACPFAGANFQRDGPMCMFNFKDQPNYIASHGENLVKFEPLDGDISKATHDKFAGVVLEKDVKEQIKRQEELNKNHENIVNAKINEYYIVNGLSPLDLEQPRALYEKVYSPEDKQHFINNVVGHAAKISVPEIKTRVTQYFGLLNEDLGKKIAEGLEIAWEPVSFEQYTQRLTVASAF